MYFWMGSFVRRRRRRRGPPVSAVAALESFFMKLSIIRKFPARIWKATRTLWAATPRTRRRALNLVAQWGQAFGGIEIKGRAGDDIVFEFSHADSALLCAAIVQEHASALRSTGLAALNWAFRIGLDTDEISDADGGNVIGTCIDRAAKLAKTIKDERSIERVILTPETTHVLSGGAHASLNDMDLEIDLALDDEMPMGAAGERARFRPVQADRVSLLANYSSRLSG